MQQFAMSLYKLGCAQNPLVFTYILFSSKSNLLAFIKSCRTKDTTVVVIVAIDCQ